MPVFKDLTGQKFGRLTVIEIDQDITKTKHLYYWRCKCDCGKIVSVRSSSLTQGVSKSCGCLQKDTVGQNNFKNLTNMVFGRLKVIRLNKSKTEETGKTYWDCKCKCGKIVAVTSNHLLSGNTKSCGCLHKDIITKSNIIEYDSNLNCLKVYFNNYDGYFLCDLDDRDVVEKYCWCRNKISGYVYSWSKENGKQIKLHRVIMSKYYNTNNLMIDHINHNILDNRKSNLRVCTASQNKINSRPTSNTGEKYISYNKINNKYYVQITTEGINKQFDSFNDAIIFRDNYMISHPNEFYYNPSEDYINNQIVIKPFLFIEKEEEE